MEQKVVLVVGPSVTAERNGYVEIANADPRKPSWIEFRKVGLGGMFPQQIKYIFAALLEEQRVDMVVLEFATAPARQADNVASRSEAMNWMLQVCRNKNLPAAVLDLPRIEMELQDDWVYGLHEQLATSRNCPYKAVWIQRNLLADAVHPTPEGRRIYADALLELTDGLVLAQAPAASGLQSKAFGCIRAKDAFDGDVMCTDFYFERAGFSSDFILLDEGQTQNFIIPPQMEVSGLSFVMGPTTGFLLLRSSTIERRISAYDRHCYYQRMGMASFPAMPGGRLSITALPDYPEVELLKGVKDSGPRQAIIGLFLTEADATP